MSRAEIVLEHIDLYLGDTHVLRDLSWRVTPGENWALLGPNGAGKSALLKLLSGDRFPRPREDCVYEVCGYDRLRTGCNVWDLKRILGVISPELQANYLPDTPGVNVVLSGFFSSNGLYNETTTEQRSSALEAMERIGVRHLEKRLMGAISYGESRRLLIARALIHQPQLLIFDEPTTGLDLAAAESFLETVQGLAKDGYSIVIVTHALPEIIPAITHVGVIRDGQIERSGTKDKIVTRQLFHDLYDLDVAIEKRDERFWLIPGSQAHHR